MRWSPGDRGNIQDARGSSGMRVGSIGIGGFLVLLLLSWATGTDFLSLLGGGGGTSPGSVATTGELRTTPEEERLVDFVDAVAKDTQDTWAQLLGGRYQHTQVVLFRDAIESACGSAQSATGPFYCPADQKVYLDLGFFNELSRRFGAPGDFAEAYVIAHEFGHHAEPAGDAARVQEDPRPARESVALELQADCYAGVWGMKHPKRTVPGRARGARTGRCRGGLTRGWGHWRRPSAAYGERPRGARALHARHLGAAHGVVQARAVFRRSAPVRHVRADDPITRRDSWSGADREHAGNDLEEDRGGGLAGHRAPDIGLAHRRRCRAAVGYIRPAACRRTLAADPLQARRFATPPGSRGWLPSLPTCLQTLPIQLECCRRARRVPVPCTRADGTSPKFDCVLRNGDIVR